jgi:3-(3-hydroxy-phenyl)propionate hydroxylase
MGRRAGLSQAARPVRHRVFLQGVVLEMSEQDRVIVVGGGPVGLLTALGLATRKVPVLVLEAEPALTIDLRAGTYHPPSLEMMASFGITEEMHKIGIRVPRWQIRDRTEGLIVEWDLSVLSDVTPYPYRFHLEQHRLTPIIYDKLRAFAHAEVRFGAPVTAVTQDADGAQVTVDDGSRCETLRARYVVGADGGRSAVRKAIGVDFEGFTWPDRFVVASTDYPMNEHGYTANAYVADPDEWAAVFQMPDAGPPGLWRVVFPVPPEESDEEALSDASCERRLQSLLARPEPYRIIYRSIYKVHQRVASDFRQGRILLAGDAAHLNNPLGAFGLNGGIHDAVNLSEKLAEVFAGRATEDLLDLYTRQRRTANIEQVQANSISNKKRLEARDPEARRRNFEELRQTAADPAANLAFLMTSSMIDSVRRASRVG